MSSEKISLVHPAWLHLIQNWAAADWQFTVFSASLVPTLAGGSGSCSVLMADGVSVCTVDILKPAVGLECCGDTDGSDGPSLTHFWFGAGSCGVTVLVVSALGAGEVLLVGVFFSCLGTVTDSSSEPGLLGEQDPRLISENEKKSMYEKNHLHTDSLK